MLDFEPELTVRGADSGANTREWFASYDPASSSWKTSQACLFAGWDVFSETWPKAGMTRNGRAFEQATWVRRIDESASSFSDDDDWSTPTCRDKESLAKVTRGANAMPGGTPLCVQVAALWPTPQATDAGAAGNRNLPGSQAHAGLSLTDVVTGGQSPRRYNWPSPNAAAERDHPDKTYSQPTNASYSDGRKCQPTLAGSIARFGLPDLENHSTPGSRPASSVVLNPAWVSCLMGFPPDWCDIGDVPLKR